jgi:hypothetical protein
MRLALMSRAIVQIATAVAVVAASLLAFAAYATHSAKSNAEAICHLLPSGIDAQRIPEIVAHAKIDPDLRTSSENQISFGFRGAMLDRWFCNVSLSGGEVVGQEVHLVD